MSGVFMPVMSYLAYPVDGKKEELIASLEAMQRCEVQPAENHDLLVLVTDTEGKEEEEALQDQLKDIESLAFLALVAGYDDPEHQSEVTNS